MVAVATLSCAGCWLIQGGLFGGGIGLVAGTMAAVTNRLAIGALSKSGGSERITGLVVSAGVLATGLVLLNQG